MGCYFALWYNTYAFSLLFYQFYMKRENASSWDSGWKRSKYWKPIMHGSKSPETPRKSFLELIRIIKRKKHLRGPTPWPGGWGARPPLLGAPLSPGGAPLSPGPPDGPPVPIFCYMKSFTLEKNHKQAYRTKLRRHEAEPWQNQSRAPAKLFCRGNIPPRGGNHHHRHHQCSSHQERAISINIFTSTISS